MLSTQGKLKHLRRYFRFSDEEIEDARRFYESDPASLETRGVKRLFTISKELCLQWNRLFVDPKKKREDRKRRRYLLRRLFPHCPSMVYVRRGISLVIGRVILSPKTFINVNASFDPLVDVFLSKKVQFGPNVRISVGCFGEIRFDEGVWVCSGVTIASSARIGKGSIIGAGSYVQGDIKENVLALGRPARAKRRINKGETFSEKERNSPLTEFEFDLLAHRMRQRYRFSLRPFFSKVIRCRPFSTANPGLGKLYLRTHFLCRRLDDENLTPKERESIIDELFPIHGENIVIGKNFFLDLIGTVALESNVTIGDNVALGGNIRIKSKAVIGDDTCLFASDHIKDYTRRGFGFHRGLGLSIPILYSPIMLQKGVRVGRGCSASPCANIAASLPAGSLALANGSVLPPLDKDE